MIRLMVHDGVRTASRLSSKVVVMFHQKVVGRPVRYDAANLRHRFDLIGQKQQERRSESEQHYVAIEYRWY